MRTQSAMDVESLLEVKKLDSERSSEDTELDYTPVHNC